MKWMDVLNSILKEHELKTETDASGGVKLIDPGFFEGKPEAALKIAGGVQLRYASKQDKPSLLLSHLPIEESKVTTEESLKYIAANTQIGPCTFFGTSGVGKTRRARRYCYWSQRRRGSCSLGLRCFIAATGSTRDL